MTDLLLEYLGKWGQLNSLGILMLGAVFILGSLIPVPRTSLYIGSGIIFGVGAIPIIVPFATIGATVAFLLSRYFFAHHVQRYAESRPKLRRIMNAVDAEGWRVVALLRLGGPIPNFVQNYLYGVTRIGLWPFVAATFLFSIPQICMYTYLGSAGKAAIEDMGSAMSLVPPVIGVIAMICAFGLIARRVQKISIDGA